MGSTALATSLASPLVLGLLFTSTVLAHGGDHDHAAESVEQDDSQYPPTYFSHPEHAGLIYTHIALMTLAWVFALPVAVMLSLAKSRYTLLSQFFFLAANSLGLVLGTIYNAQTPDLYPNNAHHRIGWVATWVVSAQVLVSLLTHIAGAIGNSSAKLPQERHSFMAVSVHAPETGHHDYYPGDHRLSNDSGQGSEPNTESLRSNSASTVYDEHRPLHDLDKEFDNDDDDDYDVNDMPQPASSLSKTAAATMAAKFVSSRIWRVVDIGYNVVDRIILPLGFIALATGFVTFGRLFEGSAIFSGLAHWIKGGVFFWLGLFTLGRWSGSFGELGWAWNLHPKRHQGQRWQPSAEFVESALIFVYGSTNIFLEHLGSDDGVWSSQDLEHLSITVLFLGGGLCGMLVESTRIRDLLNTTVTDLGPKYSSSDEEREALQLPTYEFSMNPIPALVILLLGIMMGGHHQDTMVSTMIHKQWGDLLLGASFARGLTYLLVYLKPPQSVHPSRPPTELLAAFGLMAGGIIFMVSSSDTIEGIIRYNLDAMSIYTVTLGLVGFLMAWELIVLAIKGWAIRRERSSQLHRFG